MVSYSKEVDQRIIDIRKQVIIVIHTQLFDPILTKPYSYLWSHFFCTKNKLKTETKNSN